MTEVLQGKKNTSLQHYSKSIQTFMANLVFFKDRLA